MATILVVDDEVGIRELLSEILRDENYVVDIAENAQQALAYRQQHVPDLVLLDIWMPDIDGLTVLKTWAQQGDLTMPVIMMSGHATIDTAVEATQIGALDFLEKPIALKKLLHTVEKALAQKSLRHAQPTAHSLTPPLPTTNRITFLDHSAHSGVTAALPSINLDIPLRPARDAFERAYFEYHLIQENGNMTRIAEKTGLERTHLYRKLKQLGLNTGKSKAK